LRPKLAAGWCLRAQVARAANRPQQALADFTEAIRLAPDDPLLWRHRAEFRRKRLGQIAAAVEDATRAIELDPEWALARYERGEGHRLLGQWERALDDATLAVCLNPERSRFWRARGNVWLESGHPERAVSDYSQALRREEAVAGTWVARGHAHSQLGRVREAMEDFATALRLEPGLAAAHNGRGLLLLQTVGDPGRAVVEFHEALWLDGDTPWVRANRALGFAQLGDRERAWDDIRRAERDAPNQPWVKIVKSLLLSGWEGEGEVSSATEAATLAWEGLTAGVGPQGEAWGALAAALAAGGDFRGAVNCQRRALWESQPGRQAEMARRMMRYLTHRPFRFPDNPLDHEWRSPSLEQPMATVQAE
ncbi:MAG: tetratricopeptide repeat protein, partial [Planctomycetaceae bacterium]